MLHACVNTMAGEKWKAQYGLKVRAARFNPGSARVLKSTGLFPKTSSPLVKNVHWNVTGTLHGQLERGSTERSMLRLAGRLNYNNASGFAPEASVLLRIRFFKYLGLEATGDYLSQFYHTLEGIPLGWSLDMIVPPSKRFRPEQTRQAYAAKKWAFVSDYVRLHALYREGGLYLDTDVEVLRPLDEFLDNALFTGYEANDFIMTAVIGAEHHQNDFLTFKGSPPGHFFIGVDREKDI